MPASVQHFLSRETSGVLYFLPFTGGRLGPLGAPEPLSPRPCPLRCDGAFPEGARLARVASSPPQRPFQRNWQLTLGGFLSMYPHGTPQDTAKL